MENKKKRTGFTLAETLIVVAILMVLAALAFIGVNRYTRSLAQLEYDVVAKEIYVVAQNHLTMAKSQGFLSAASSGAPDSSMTNICYYVVPGDNPNDNTSALGLMLPFGSIDEYVRSGSYIIRYNKKTSEVLDVFYSNPNGRHGHSFVKGNYAQYMAVADINYDGTVTSKKEARRNYNGDVLGYYGGLLADGPSIPSMTMLDPTITVENKDKLKVIINNPNPEITGSRDNGLVLQLHIKGKTSGNEKIVTLLKDGANAYRLQNGSYEVVLDDITADGKHFSELCGEGEGCFPGPALIPGEEIELWATCDSNTVLVDRQGVSERKQTNSLFGDDTVVDASNHTVRAEIAYIRHLENLSQNVSSVGYRGGTGLDPLTADQTRDLSWVEFMSNTNGAGTQIHYGSNLTSAGTYLPVTPGVSLSYNGNGNKITGIRVDTSGDGGVFATLLDGSSVQNLKIVNALISADGAAGSLVGVSAGATSGVQISHVQAEYDKNDTASYSSSLIVQGGNSTGGLIGSIAKGTIDCCFASVYVASGNGDAGGLVGSAANVSISSSYSGGHTQYGQYVTDNVSGKGNVGGLIGALAGGNVSASYSTCSVNGTSAAGGLIGKVSNTVEVNNSYAVGKVEGSGAKGALIGSGTISSTSHGNYYLRIINGELESGDSNALRIDQNLDSYKKFFGNLEAEPYDDFLDESYQRHFGMKTVSQLTNGAAEMNSHVGDWPAPEIFIINSNT